MSGRKIIRGLEQVLEVTRIQRRIAELDAAIAAKTCWGAAITAMDEERAGLVRHLTTLMKSPSEAGEEASHSVEDR